ncbi:MAG TPA: Jag N-terminal domain-containing protein [Candidatus Saccharimonadales bacterium]|nr:Jag N-terminal domain-containing protein [Candidatus Saccharimonadales bacterium]
MQIKYSMKSVLAQGTTVVKAIEEALKKADMPQEFFVKILEEAQPGFLGFGSKKAKIALFFRKEMPNQKGDGILSQSSYEHLFNNQALQKQIDNQQREVSSTKEKKESKPQAVIKQASAQQPYPKKQHQFQQRELKSISSDHAENRQQDKGMQRNQVRPLPKPMPKPIPKIDKQQRSERRPQDMSQRPLPVSQDSGGQQHRKDQSSVSKNSQQQAIHKSDQSGQPTQQRSNYRNTRRSRYYSPRRRHGNNEDKNVTSSSKNNNDDSNNS